MSLFCVLLVVLRVCKRGVACGAFTTCMCVCLGLCIMMGFGVRWDVAKRCGCCHLALLRLCRPLCLCDDRFFSLSEKSIYPYQLLFIPWRRLTASRLLAGQVPCRYANRQVSRWSRTPHDTNGLHYDAERVSSAAISSALRPGSPLEGLCILTESTHIEKDSCRQKRFFGGAEESTSLFRVIYE